MLKRLLSSIRLDLHVYLQNRIIRITTYGNIFFIFLTLLIPLFYWNSLPPSIPLWFSRPWGLERLASLFWIFLLPCSNIFWLLIAINISIRLLKDHLVFSQILSIITILTSIMSCITVITIISLVI